MSAPPDRAFPPTGPGAGAEVQQPGTLIQRPLGGAPPKLKRIYKGKDDKAYFTEFSELFPKVLDEWGAPHAITGFRLLCWENGSMDWHPCVTNQLAIALAGEMEMEVGGGGGAIEVFHAGRHLSGGRPNRRGTHRAFPPAEWSMWSSWSSKQKTFGSGRRDS